MYKVQNELLQQETNQGLIDIRTNELNYFTGFFSSYGSQAATLGGLMLSASTNFSLLEAEETYHRAWSRYIYWISVFICICFSLHLVLTTIFLTVFGPGLALRGPIGSMTRAVDGMNHEQDATLYSFIGLVVSLGVSMIASFWSWMTEGTAAFLTFTFAIQVFFWYQHSIRIYNRFKYDAIDVTHFGELSSGSPQKIHRVKVSRNIQSDDPLYTKALQTTMEGFLMIMKKNSGLLYSSVSWERKYFVLKEMILRSYTKKSDYETNPEGYDNLIDMSFLVFRWASIREKDGTLKIIIGPEKTLSGHYDEVYSFTCDLEDEFEKWVSALDTVVAGAKFILGASKLNISDDTTMEQGFIDIR